MGCGCCEGWTHSVDRLVSTVEARSRTMDRRQALRALAATVSFAAGCGPVTSAHRQAAADLARESISVDLHSHAGMLRSSTTSLDGQLERMARGTLKASLFSAVADGPVLGLRPHGGLYATREPKPGELYAHTYSALARVMSRAPAGKLRLIERPPDLDAARQQGRPSAILAVEGGDFLEGRIERVEQAYDRGIRCIQLTHYRVNELGDIQTEAPRHGGLTPFGRDVIREMNRLGLIVDVAHLTYDGVRTAVAVSTKPMILSHTVLDVPFSRAVTVEHARLVAARQGVVGVFPVSVGYHGFAGYIEHIVRMINAVGADHVGIGTDLDGIVPASFATFADYAEWPSIAAALLARGYSRQDVAKVTGGNFFRVFSEVTTGV